MVSSSKELRPLCDTNFTPRDQGNASARAEMLMKKLSAISAIDPKTIKSHRPNPTSSTQNTQALDQKIDKALRSSTKLLLRKKENTMRDTSRAQLKRSGETLNYDPTQEAKKGLKTSGAKNELKTSGKDDLKLNLEKVLPIQAECQTERIPLAPPPPSHPKLNRGTSFSISMHSRQTEIMLQEKAKSLRSNTSSPILKRSEPNDLASFLSSALDLRFSSNVSPDSSGDFSDDFD